MRKGSEMMDFSLPSLRRRSLLTGAAGGAALFAAPAMVRAQGVAPPRAPGAQGGGQTAVIDVNRARTDPIPIALPALVGSDGASSQLGQDIMGVVSSERRRRDGKEKSIISEPFLK